MAVPADFPVACSAVHRHGDAEITYLHHHDQIEIGYCRRGDGVFMVEDKLLPFKAGDVIFITPFETHLARSRKGTVSEWHWIYLDPEALEWAEEERRAWRGISRLQGAGFRNVLAGDRFPGLSFAVRSLVEELLSRREGFVLWARGYLCLVAAELARASMPPPGKGARPGRGKRGGEAGAETEERAFPGGAGDSAGAGADVRPGLGGGSGIGARAGAAKRDRRILPAVNLMGQEYGEKLPTEKLARACNLSITHFRRLFRTETGKTPLSYLNDLRVRMAMNFLADPALSVSGAARLAGFETLSTLDRRFRAATGMSPREWKGRKPGPVEETRSGLRA